MRWSRTCSWSRRVYFPRLILPASSVVATLVDFAASLGMLFVLMAVFGVWPGAGLLLLPVWLTILMVLALGIGMAAGAVMVRYRDVQHLVPVALQMGLYISPVVWSTLFVPAKYRWVFLVNPLSGLLDAFRWSLLGEGSLSWGALAYSAAAAVVALALGVVIFNREERGFADVI